MPAPVRYRSTAVVYVAGGADMVPTRARGNRSATTAPSSVTGSIGAPAYPSGTAAVNAYTSPRRPESPAAVNPVFTAAVANASPRSSIHPNAVLLCGLEGRGLSVPDADQARRQHCLHGSCPQILRHGQALGEQVDDVAPGSLCVP